MSYIIVGEFDPHSECVEAGAIERLLAKPEIRFLADRPGAFKVDIRGDFHRKEELTRFLCESLISAGIYAFEIRHSY